MSTIGVDIDSTLYPFDEPARDACFYLYDVTGEEPYKRAAHSSGSEWRSFTDILGPERWQSAVDLVHSYETVLSRVPFEGAVNICNALNDEGHELIFISNRSARCLGSTSRWLDEQGLLRDNYVETIEQDKLSSLSSCQYLIDDRVKTVIQFVYNYQWTNVYGSLNREKERHAFVKAYPYNQNLTDVPNVWVSPSWSGIGRYLFKLGLLSSRTCKVLQL